MGETRKLAKEMEKVPPTRVEENQEHVGTGKLSKCMLQGVGSDPLLDKRC
jgi:hypothetical protein